MRYSLFIILFLSLGLGLFFSQSLRFQSTVVDLGDVPEGEKISFQFRYENITTDTIRVSKKYKPGDFVEEYELEKNIKKQTGAFPQLSVQDYSKVKSDDKGNYVVKLNNKK